jgi:hypothetical protein
MRSSRIILTLVLAVVVVLGVARAVAQDATPEPDGAPITLVLVERSGVPGSETITDIGDPGFSAGDTLVWGPNPLYDAGNADDTGAVTAGSCQILNTNGDGHCIETITFPDGSTIAVQGIQLGHGERSTTTIVGGSGQYLHASGTLIVEASEDRSLWTKSLEIWLN